VADLTEVEIIAVRKAHVGRYGQCDVTKPYSDSIAFAQAIIKAQREKDTDGVEAPSAAQLAAAREVVSRAFLAGPDDPLVGVEGPRITDGAQTGAPAPQGWTDPEKEPPLPAWGGNMTVHVTDGVGGTPE
jgi:hypothetical protein